MRQFNSLCSSKHSVLFNRSSLFIVNHVPIRYASLSAIHRGLRESEKSRPQGFVRDALNTKGPRKPQRNTSRSRRDPDWTPPGFKLSKGKKDITDKGPRPKSRSERFNDPSESFGKKSLVYQAKNGNLREELSVLAGGTKTPGQGSFESKFSGTFEDDFSKERRSSSRNDSRRENVAKPRASKSRTDFGRRGSGSDFRRDEASSRPSRSSGFMGRSKDRSSRGFDDGRGSRSDDRGDSRFDDKPPHRFDDARSPRSEGQSYGRFDGRPARRFDNARGPRSEDQSNSRFDDRPARKFEDRPSTLSSSPSADTPSFRSSVPRDDLPIRIRHTTAASQFLYGRSVVEAALRASRRKVYHLYLYAGQDRQNLVQDATLEKLATQKGVQVTKIVDNDGLRMMDKMSGGRPHNGCVLETSPTPQIPLKSLGVLSEDPASPSFKIELAYQSAEETAINGNPDTITYQAKGNRKPFFLLLDGILDPGNLGAILRTAAFLGVTGVVISKHGSSGLTPVSLKASSGASEVLPLYSTQSTPDFIERSKENGWIIYASVAAGPRSRGNSHLTLDRIESYDPLSEHPTILVIGSEGEGLEKKIKRLSDFEVSIPGQSGLLSTIDSLNVSVATGIMVSAFLKKSQGFEIEEARDEIKGTEDDDTPLW